MMSGKENEVIYKDKKWECCVFCGKVTSILKEQPISKRKYYIEGAGQLCFECYHELYVPSCRENVVQFEHRP